MLTLIRSLAAPLFSLVLLISASGLFNTFISVRLEMEGYGNEAIGAVVSALYIGILAGSLWLDRWISRFGHIRSFIAFSLILTLIVLSQALWIDPYYWSALRFIGGICTAGIFIVIESWLLVQATSAMRGGILSVYLAVFYGALSSGQLLINLSDPMGYYPFWITAGLTASSVLPFCFKKVSEPQIRHTSPLSIRQLFHISPFGFFGGVVSATCREYPLHEVNSGKRQADFCGI